MRCFTILTVLFLAVGATTAREHTDEPCGGYGTAVDFHDSPSAAAAEAKRDQKLVFVLHVSGHFEDPGVT